MSGCLEVHLLLLGVAALGGLNPVSHMQHYQGPRVPVAEPVKPSCGKQAAGGDEFQSSDFFHLNDLWHTEKGGCTIYQELHFFFFFTAYIFLPCAIVGVYTLLSALKREM